MRVALACLLSMLTVATAFADEPSRATWERTAKDSWAQSCHSGGIKIEGEGDRKMFREMVNRCTAMDACHLACFRSGCADGIGGGCFHTCGDDMPEKQARDYEDKTSSWCKPQAKKAVAPKPNQSLGPTRVGKPPLAAQLQC